MATRENSSWNDIDLPIHHHWMSSCVLILLNILTPIIHVYVCHVYCILKHAELRYRKYCVYWFLGFYVHKTAVITPTTEKSFVDLCSCYVLLNSFFFVFIRFVVVLTVIGFNTNQYWSTMYQLWVWLKIDANVTLCQILYVILAILRFGYCFRCFVVSSSASFSSSSCCSFFCLEIWLIHQIFYFIILFGPFYYHTMTT